MSSEAVIPRLALALATMAALAAIPACGPNRTRPDRPALDEDGGTIAPLDCVPNLDGRIDARELEPALGVSVSYLVNPPSEPRPVDLVGTEVGGARAWDLGTDYASDAVATIAASELAGRWFAGSFPAGQFVAPLDLAGTTLGVYRHGDTALELLGVASRDESPPEGRTLIAYETPIVVLQLPLVPGARWVSTSEVRDATIRGLPYAGRDTYDVRVADEEGTLVLPDLTFEHVLRVRTHVTIEPAAGEPVTRRQSSFFFECFGEVARATSLDGETIDDFTTAAELRRFGL